jgi:hypothetical protein
MEEKALDGESNNSPQIKDRLNLGNSCRQLKMS